MLLSEFSLSSSISDQDLSLSPQPTFPPSCPWPLHRSSPVTTFQGIVLSHLCLCPCYFSCLSFLLQPIKQKPLVLQGPIKWHSFCMWSLPQVPRVCHSEPADSFCIHVSIPQTLTIILLIHSQVYLAHGVQWMNAWIHQISGQILSLGSLQL